MDENYLDQLLRNAENNNGDIPEEPDMEEVVTQEEARAEEVQMEEALSADAETVQDVALSDAEIPAEEISELDALDEQADLDIDSMDFDDIDFDDLDVTSMNTNPVPFQKELEDINELSIDEEYLDDLDFEKEFQQMKDEEERTPKDTDFVNTLDPVEEPVEESGQEEEIGTESSDIQETVASDLEDSSTGGMDADSLFEEVFGSPDSESAEQETEVRASDESVTMQEAASDQGQTNDSSNEMDDLFSMLGIEGNGTDTSMPTDEIPDFDIPPELADVKDVKQEKKKSRFMEILFGDDEDDEPTPEQLEALEKEKEEKLQAKLAKKEQKKAQKAENDAKKKEAKAQKTAQVTAKKEARKAEDERILAEDGPEKKLNKVLVAIVMIFFLAIGGTVILGTTIFDYTLVITKATNYFERQRYGMAYREIIGVDVKEKDQELKDKIYTVMYVERQYEAYQNYVSMNRPDLALDALLQGLGKYDTYYDDAVELGIVDDLDFARAEILQALNTTYGLSESEAKEILRLAPSEYTSRVNAMTLNISFAPGVE